MIKKVLKNMPVLKATPTMLRRAMEDKPKEVRQYEYYKKYKHWMQLRCCVQNGILKISCFLTDNMRFGGTLSVYDIYCNYKTKEYLTYSRQKDKWLTASLYRLDWPTYWLSIENVYVSREAKKTIRKYFHTEKCGLDALDDFQKDILAENLKLRHKKETDPWDADLKQTPKIPKSFNRWVDKDGIPEHFIFYEYSRKKNQTGYCTYCEKWVPIESPHYNAESICPCCKHKIVYKSLGRVGYFRTGDYPLYLLQRCKDGMIIRRFWCYRIYRRGKPFEPDIRINEGRRIICDKQAHPQRAYYWGDYKQTTYRWIESDIWADTYDSRKGKIYKNTLPSLSGTILKQTGLIEYYKKQLLVNPESYLCRLEKRPYIEKLVKVGLFTLANEQLKYGGYSFEKTIKIAANESSLTKMLSVDRYELKRLRDCDGGTDFLVWLQYEKATNKPIPDETIKWLCEYDVEPKDLKFIRHKMSVAQIVSYIKQQMEKCQMNYRDTLNTWTDYLAMAKGLGIDTDLEIIYKPRNLKLKHNQMVKQCHDGKDITIAIGELKEKYPTLEKVITETKGKYEYADDEYVIVQPSCIKDILIESRTLQHCGDSEKYFDRIARQESYIMFLRKADEPEKAYYTLEVEPDGGIRQKRTMYNELHNDFLKAEPFLKEWQLIVRKRLDENDRELAKQSKVMRLQEFEQLRKDKIIIRSGSLKGALLADVLMKDFMAAA